MRCSHRKIDHPDCNDADARSTHTACARFGAECEPARNFVPIVVCTPVGERVRTEESYYLSRAFERKLHGQTPQLFDQVQAPVLQCLHDVGGDGIVVKTADLGLCDPDADQVAGNEVAFREPMQGLAGKKFLRQKRLVGNWRWRTSF